ncbi:MAG TPA: Crp/Fnr family transcriptional regulator [Solirubrobacteraceae bacterium]|nr:Crp/Fnr family transcriptional regulator [Solirubrobacteraceae bacterium]
MASSPTPERVALLDAEPDLAAGLAPEERELALRVVAAPVLGLSPGAWDGQVGPDSCGAIVLDGLLTLRAPLDGGAGLQLRGAGDVLLACTADGLVTGEAVRWTVSEGARLAVLDEAFLAATRRWPALLAALLRRLAAQQERLAVQHAIAQLPRVDQRIRALLWHLAERWGRVTRSGVVVPLTITHEVLGHLVGSRRPTVSLALTELEEQGLVLRQPDRSWLLTEDPPGPLRGRAEQHAGAGTRARPRTVAAGS